MAPVLIRIDLRLCQKLERATHWSNKKQMGNTRKISCQATSHVQLRTTLLY